MPIRITISIESNLKGAMEVEVDYNKQEPALSANIRMVNGEMAGVEVKGYVGRGVTRDDITKLARDFEKSVGDILEKLAS